MVPKPAIFHMLKSMGIDVTEIETAAKQLPQVAMLLAEKVTQMDAKLDRILVLLEPKVQFLAASGSNETHSASYNSNPHLNP